MLASIKIKMQECSWGLRIINWFNKIRKIFKQNTEQNLSRRRNIKVTVWMFENFHEKIVLNGKIYLKIGNI